MAAKLHSDVAERAVISTCVFNPHLLGSVALDSRQFRHPARRVIWDALLALQAAGRGVDETLAMAVFEDGNEHVRCEFVECMDSLGIASMIGEYVAKVREDALTRDIVEALGKSLHEARAGEVAGHELLAHVQGSLSLLNQGRPGSTRTMRQMVRALSAELDDAFKRRQEGEDVVRGIPTGVAKWDEWGGIHRGIVTIVGGRPGMGKSALAQQVTKAAIDRGYGVHVFSMEDTESSYTSRALARESGVPLSSIRGARLSTGDMRRIVPAMGRLAQWARFSYEDIATATGAEVVSAVRREKDAKATQLVVVDYVQLMRAPDKRLDEQAAIDANLTTLSRAAKDDNIAYLVLSQLNRKCESRPDKRPIAADFRGAGQIEERAKTVMAVFRPGVYDTSIADDTMELLVLKNNDGPTGDIHCDWDGRCTMITGR